MTPYMKPTRSPIPIQIKEILITYDGDNHFKIRIYDPVDEVEATKSPRPVLLTVHGGGWSQGSAESDDRTHPEF